MQLAELEASRSLEFTYAATRVVSLASGDSDVMGDLHFHLLPYLWTFGVDIAIFFALYKHTKYSLFIHAATSLMVGLPTLVTALSLLVQMGVPKEQSDFRLQRHAILGIAIIIVIIMQIVLGGVSRTLQLLSLANSRTIYRLAVCHKYLGYMLMILGKIQAYLMLQKIYYEEDPTFFWSLAAADIFLIVMLLIRKYTWPTFSSKILPHNTRDKTALTANLSELKEKYQDLCIFANYIYDLTPMRRWHPIGYKIIESVKDRQLDRYFYGMYRAEGELSIPPNTHGYRSLQLVGEPLGKLQIPSIYFGLEDEIVKVKIVKVRQISSKGDIYEIELSSENQEEFEYRGYESVEQLGRYYSLTLDRKITRLYTVCGFLTTRNINFMKEQCFNSLPTTFQQVSKSEVYFSSLSIPILNDSDTRRRIRILVKRYPTGLLSEPLIERCYQSLWLSTARGRGLQFGQLRPGKIIIVAGGTGLFPFCDLIDLLFKSTLMTNKARLRPNLQLQDPILKQQPFKGFSFEMFLSVNNLQDIHPLILAELIQLVKEPTFFDLTIRLVNVGQTRSRIHPNVKIISDRFEGVLGERLRRGDFQKIWVCGPPRMNRQMLILFDRQGLPADKFVIL